ncbi:MAG: 6,7-dimethyl-8-ribityllumazine synthase [Candidatus Omnitrophica bacterium]|nr:6,7-dimethyl-8-ribityllumazine synthase [Candidatus Omnitrophota bacterium]MBI2174782.1 6,7-dimethyl-8-ribityllumazine synthase [Candidatus Omnitrophota bacterium]
MRSSARPLYAPNAASGKHFVIAAASFHSALTSALVRAALDVLHRAQAASTAVRIVEAPGVFELPLTALRAAKMYPRPDAIIALGCVIRGQTSQYQVIAHAAAQGLMQVSLSRGIPVTFGVIVAESLAQAKARAGGRLGNRGREAAKAALAMLQKKSGSL